MTSREKIGAYLSSFDPQDPNYDFACYIKEKLGESLSPIGMNGMHEEENNESGEFETPEVDKTNSNIEGKMMEAAFKDLDVLNELNKQDAQIKTSGTITNILNKLRGN